MTKELSVSLMSLVLVGCSSSASDHDAGMPDIALADAAPFDQARPDLSRPGLQLYETFCPMDLSATYTRCYAQAPSPAY